MNKRIRSILISFLSFIIFFLIGLIYYENNKFVPIIKFKDNLNFEYASNIYLKQLVLESNINIIDVQLDTFSLGEKKIIVSYLDDRNKEKTFDTKISYNVVDTTNPIILASTTRTTYVGEEIDLIKGQICADNEDGNIECTIEGEYDFNVVGTYYLKYVAEDLSSNKTEKNFNLIVKEKESETTLQNPPQNSTPKYDKIDDIINEYKNDNNEIGIDVSRWQGDNIDFNKVKSSGVSFVIIRLGVQDGYNGEYGIDRFYQTNIEKAQAAGLKVGVYFYSYANSIMEASKQADWVVDNLNNVHLDLPVVFDWEDWDNFNSINLNLYEFNQMAYTFLNQVKSRGYDSMLYGSKYYLENIWMPNNNNVWLAHYTSRSSYAGKYMMWQLSNNGKVDGIDGVVDLDILYLKKEEE